MSLKNSWQQRSQREKAILGGAGVILVVLIYYLFVIEPLAKKTTQLQAQTEALREQLPEIKQMVSAIEHSGDYTEALNKLQSIAEQTSQNGSGMIYMTTPLPEQQAKTLFQALYPHGKSQLIQKDNGVIVWHHAK